MAPLARSCLGYLLLVLWPVAAVDIYTPGSLEALNGTDVRLKCTFNSRDPIGQQLTITWNFQPQEKGETEFVFHYIQQPFSATKGRFAGRVTWDGNVHRKDASIIIWDVRPQDNGTFQCHVKNPPDVDGVAGEIQLSVVMKVSFSEIHILAIIIGAACFLMIVVVIAVVVCRHRRKMQRDRSMEVVETELPEKEKLRESKEKSKVAQPGEDN